MGPRCGKASKLIGLGTTHPGTALYAHRLYTERRGSVALLGSRFHAAPPGLRVCRGTDRERGPTPVSRPGAPPVRARPRDARVRRPNAFEKLIAADARITDGTDLHARIATRAAAGPIIEAN